MSRYKSFAIGTLVVAIGCGDGFAQVAPDVIERGKKATALVELSNRGGWTGTAFCVDKIGLFLTNTQVIEAALDGTAKIHLVLEAGFNTERRVRAKVLRHDDLLGLALLQVDNKLTAEDLRQDVGNVLKALVKLTESIDFTPLSVAQTADLSELADVATFGFPFRQSPAGGRFGYPEVTVVPSHISALRKENGRLLGIQVDSELNLGQSGGPVVDTSGRVIGVIAATVSGAAMNLAKPAHQLADFLAAPGLEFEPAPLTEQDCTHPVVWTIQVVPATPVAKLPEGLSVSVKLTSGIAQPRTYTAEPTGAGAFKVTLGPLRSILELGVELIVKFGFRNEPLTFRQKDREIKIGAQTFKLSDIKEMTGGSSPHVQTVAGQTVAGPVEGLGQVRVRHGQMTMVGLNYASQISVRPFDLPGQDIVTLVEVKQGSQVVASVRKRVKFAIPTPSVPPATPKATARALAPTPVPARAKPAGDEGTLRLGGALNVDGVPRGAGKDIKRPRVAVPTARLTQVAEPGAEAPLERRLDGAISDVAVGGGGRYLLLLLKNTRKLAVFDLNAADVVKTIPLTSAHALVSAGASKFLVAFPDEKHLERWDLATLTQQGEKRPLPFDGQLKEIAMGSDSAGPVLAFWFTGADRRGYPFSYPRFSFVDLDSLTVQKIGSIANRTNLVVSKKDTLSASGGSFMLDPSLRREAHVSIRASSGGGVFGVWQLAAMSKTLTVEGSSVSFYEHGNFGHLAPGPDGHTVFTAVGRRRSVNEPIDGVMVSGTKLLPDVTIPSADSALYLSISGLPGEVAGTEPLGSADYPAAQPGPVTASVHATNDGSRLFTVYGLDEMSVVAKRLDWYKDNLTTDKRFYLVPAAGLLITIPPQNDRLVLRRLDIDEAMGKSGRDEIIVVSPPALTATAGGKLEHQIAARSRKGGITYSLTRGPDGLTVAEDGKLVWLVPQGMKGQELSVVVTVGDASGQERFVTLKIHVK